MFAVLARDSHTNPTTDVADPAARAAYLAAERAAWELARPEQTPGGLAEWEAQRAFNARDFAETKGDESDAQSVTRIVDGVETAIAKDRNYGGPRRREGSLSWTGVNKPEPAAPPGESFELELAATRGTPRVASTRDDHPRVAAAATDDDEGDVITDGTILVAASAASPQTAPGALDLFEVETFAPGAAALAAGDAPPDGARDDGAVARALARPNAWRGAFTATRAGAYRLSVTYGGDHVAGSPFALWVAPGDASNRTTDG